MTGDANDALMAGFDKRLALIEQAQKLNARASDAQTTAITKSIDALSAQVTTALGVMNTATSDAASTPAGRSILLETNYLRDTARLHDVRLDEHQTIIDEVRGSLRAIKGLVMVMGGISSALAIFAFLQAVPS